MSSKKESVNIYVCRMPGRSDMDPKEAETLPAYRRERLNASVSEHAAASNYAAGIMLRDILGVREDGDVTFSASGKPYLASGSAFFSLSHDGEHVVLAVGNSELGVDAETPRELRKAVRKRVFTEEERRYCEGDDMKAVSLWTRLEAALKLTGEGIRGIYKREFSLLEDNSGIFFSTEEYDGSVISVACAEPFKTVLHDFDIKGDG